MGRNFQVNSDDQPMISSLIDVIGSGGNAADNAPGENVLQQVVEQPAFDLNEIGHVDGAQQSLAGFNEGKSMDVEPMNTNMLLGVDRAMADGNDNLFNPFSKENTYRNIENLGFGKSQLELAENDDSVFPETLNAQNDVEQENKEIDDVVGGSGGN